MKNFPRSLKLSVLAAAGIAMALTFVSFADEKPAPGSYILTIKKGEYVPVKDKTKLEDALRKNTKDKMKWKDNDGKESDIPASTAMRTSRIMISEKAQTVQLTTIGANVTQRATFGTAAGLKAVVDALQ